MYCLLKIWIGNFKDIIIGMLFVIQIIKIMFNFLILIYRLKCQKEEDMFGVFISCKFLLLFENVFNSRCIKDIFMEGVFFGF